MIDSEWRAYVLLQVNPREMARLAQEAPDDKPPTVEFRARGDETGYQVQLGIAAPLTIGVEPVHEFMSSYSCDEYRALYELARYHATGVIPLSVP